MALFAYLLARHLHLPRAATQFEFVADLETFIMDPTWTRLLMCHQEVK
jgi:hypothetical protein